MNRYPMTRLRRLRNKEAVRDLVGETTLSTKDLIYPIFVTYGQGVKKEIDPMPGIHQFSLDMLVTEVKDVQSLGIPAVLLFGIPSQKDDHGTEAYKADGIVQQAIRTIKQHTPELVVIGDICLCEFTSHGHCGVISDNQIDNDRTLELLGEMAVSQAKAGVDMVAPSAMMDGQVAAIRSALDKNKHTTLPIMSYSAKYSSSFYGPFRIAAESTPSYGDRKSYQMDSRNSREAMREIEQDLNEGADIIMVKPALSYLDIVATAKTKFTSPIAVYNVSGEYSMVKAAAEQEWIDEESVILEILTSIKRAGADMIITYHAKEIAEKL